MQLIWLTSDSQMVVQAAYYIVVRTSKITYAELII